MRAQAEFRVGDFEESLARSSDGRPLVILTNLPYSRRLEDAEKTLSRFVDMLERRGDVRAAFVINGFEGLRAMVGNRLHWEPLVSFNNRGPTVELVKLTRRSRE